MVDLEQKTRSPSTTRSARGCHPCLRYNLLPMSPGRTHKNWSGRRDSNPRPRPWQGRALPLSYTRIRAIGGDWLPATGRAMPNAALECNSPRIVRNRPDGRLSAIMLKDSFETARERPPTLLYLTLRREILPTGVFRSSPRRWIGQIVGKGRFPTAGISSASCRSFISRASNGLAGRLPLPARNHLPADCKSNFQPPIKARAMLEPARSARHQTRIP